MSGTLPAIIVIILSSIVIVSIIGMYLVAFMQGREINFWPPKIGAKPDVTTVTTNEIPSENKPDLPVSPRLEIEDASFLVNDDFNLDQLVLLNIPDNHLRGISLDELLVR